MNTIKTKYDVVLIGAGPGGTIAAKKCSEYGLSTLLVERQRLPRDKVCSGMIMGKWAQDILVDNFGIIPNEILVTPASLLGYAVHVNGTQVQTLDIHTPITWRKYLDQWMVNCAKRSGTEFLDGTRLVNIDANNHGYSVELMKGESQIKVKSRYLIGADGARSSSRKLLFPLIKPVYWHCYRQCFKVKLELPERRFNFFSTLETAPFYFCTHDKDGYMLLEGGAPIGKIKETVTESRQYLINWHGLSHHQGPTWRDACVEPILYGELFSGKFRPATGNALIVGDAAGLNMPVTGEGIGTSMMSGMEAANAIIRSVTNNRKADAIYLHTIDRIISKFKEIYQHSRKIKAAADSHNPKTLSDALLESWEFSLRAFDDQI